MTIYSPFQKILFFFYYMNSENKKYILAARIKYSLSKGSLPFLYIKAGAASYI